MTKKNNLASIATIHDVAVECAAENTFSQQPENLSYPTTIA